MEPDSPTDEEKQSKPDEGISDFTMVCLNYKTILTYFITLSYKISTQYEDTIRGFYSFSF